jgi:hypothetical protein
LENTLKGNTSVSFQERYLLINKRTIFNLNYPIQILDEVFRILYYIASTHPLGRAYKVTDELFDLSTMAMEYFKENIEPTLPEITYFGSDFLDFTPPFATPSKRLQLPLNVGFDSPISSRASAVGSSCSEPPLPYNNRK